jgi:hypothetical protein
MPPPMPMPSMQSPAVSFGNCAVNEILAIAMPGHRAGLSNLQIEEQLRAAAVRVDVYED